MTTRSANCHSCRADHCRRHHPTTGADVSPFRRLNLRKPKNTVTEAQLEAHAESFRSLYDYSQVGIFRSRVSDGAIVECNLRAAQIFGCTDPSEVVLTYLTSEHYADPTFRERLMQELVTVGRVDNWRAQLTRVDGKSCWISCNSRLLPGQELVETVAIDVTEQREAEEALRIANLSLVAERVSLQEKNTALRELLQQVEQVKQQACNNVQANIEGVVFPVIRALKESAAPGQREYVTLLEKCVSDIAAPFMNRLLSQKGKLTPREIEICTMIKHGLTSKEISRALHISSLTVSKHRELIRRKLDLTNQDANLASFLQNL